MPEEKLSIIQATTGVVSNLVHWSEQCRKFEPQKKVDSEYKLNAGFDA